MSNTPKNYVMIDNTGEELQKILNGKNKAPSGGYYKNENELNDHIDNSSIHVTQDEKNTWNKGTFLVNVIQNPSGNKDDVDKFVSDKTFGEIEEAANSKKLVVARLTYGSDTTNVKTYVLSCKMLFALYFVSQEYFNDSLYFDVLVCTQVGKRTEWMHEEIFFANKKDTYTKTETQNYFAEQTGTIKTDIEGIKQDIQNESHFRGYLFTNAEVATMDGTPNDFAYSAESGTLWVYDGIRWVDTTNPVPDQLVPASDTTPLMNGTASVGSEEAYARGDHRHPTDTTRVSVEAFNSKANDIDSKLEEQTSEIISISNAVNGKQNKVDDSLQTVNKSIPEAINEVYDIVKENTNETILYEGVVDTPFWENQPLVQGVINNNIKSGDYYYVTFIDSTGNTYDNIFFLKPLCTDEKNAYPDMAFNLFNYDTGMTNSSDEPVILTEGYPVQVFVERAENREEPWLDTISFRDAGVRAISYSFVNDNKPNWELTKPFGKLRVVTHGQYVHKSTINGYYRCVFNTYASTPVLFHNSYNNNSILEGNTHQFCVYTPIELSNYDKNHSLYDCNTIELDGNGYFTVTREMFLRDYASGKNKKVLYSGKGFGNTVTNSKITRIEYGSQSASFGLMKNGTYIRISEVK